MQNNLAPDIITKAIELLRPVAGTQRVADVHFMPTAKYADSFVRGHRKGSGFLGMSAPQPQAAFDEIDINITFRPGALGDGWTGYTITIASPETNPTISGPVHKWPQTGGEEFVEPSVIIGQLEPYVRELLSGSTTPTQPTREAPDTMF